MKRFLKPFTIALTLATIISSCDKDESEKSNALIGDWTLNSEEHKSCTDPLDNDFYSEPCNSSDCVTLTFKNDGNFEYKFLESGVITIEGGTYAIDGDKITCGVYDDFWCESAGPVTFKIANTTLTIAYSDDEPECTVVEIYTKKN